MTTTPRYCIDCEHFRPGKNVDRPAIGSSCGISGYVDRVSGEATHWACQTARLAGEPCGPAGNLWQRRAAPVFSLVAEAAMLPEDVA